MKMVVGLGNPGRKYAGTRHNIGFDVLDSLASQDVGGRWQLKFDAEVREISLGGDRVLLVAPQTMMNLSGRSVRAIVDFYKIPIADLLVICDDLNLPTGRLRLRAAGSSGGQKGLKNIIDRLGSEEFARLRIGIDRPPEGGDVVGFVLQPFSRAERAKIDEAVERSASAVEMWVREGLVNAMNRYNQSSESPKSGSGQ